MIHIVKAMGMIKNIMININKINKHNKYNEHNKQIDIRGVENESYQIH